MAPLRETEPGQRRVERYGAGGFRILGTAHQGSVLILPDRVVSWPVAAIADATADSLAPLLAVKARFQFVLIGVGARAALLPKPLRLALVEAGVRFDLMDTGAACRTFNVLIAEDRQVAAALIAVD